MRLLRFCLTVPGLALLIAMRSPLFAQAKDVNWEDSHTQWYAVGPCGRQRPRDSPGDIRRLFIYRTTFGNAGFTWLRGGVGLTPFGQRPWFLTASAASAAASGSR